MYLGLRNLGLNSSTPDFATKTFDFVGGGGSGNSLITYSGGANGTRVNEDGLIESAVTPRIDYNPVTLACKGLLVEEQRTNLLTYSNTFSDTSWVPTNMTAPTATTTGPDGAQSGWVFGDSNAGGTGTISIYKLVTVATLTTYTFSIYLKASGLSWAYVRGEAFTTPAAGGAYFDLSNGATGTVDSGYTARISDAGNGWWRCSITFTTDAADTSGTLRVYLADGNGDAVVDLDGTSSIYGYGAQFEAGAFATSYIPTVATSVTRTADSATITGASFSGFYNQNAGTIYAEFDVNATTGTRPVLSLDDNTANNRIELYTSGTSLKATITTGGVAQADLTLGTVAAGSSYKVAFTYTANDVRGIMTGGSLQSDNSASIPVVDRARFGSSQAGNYLNGHCKKVHYWNRSLDSTTLASLVT